MKDAQEYDVVVVGGGAAGLSGALTLGRARRSVLVVDAGEPRNAPAAAVHGYLGREGTPPAELLAIGRTEIEQYDVGHRRGRAVSAHAIAGGFVVRCADGLEVWARRLLVTTGLVDDLPPVPGLAQRWGRDVLHCPYCHGWEVRDRSVGVLATGPFALHQVQLFRQWTADLTLLLHTTEPSSAVVRERLDARGIRVVTGAVSRLHVTGDVLTGVVLADETVVPLGALVVGAPVRARSEVLESLGIHAEPRLLGETEIGALVPSEPTGATSVPGVFVAGNVTDPSAHVVSAAAAGQLAGAMINADLVDADTRDAVVAYQGRAAA